ncbi:MAG: helix-turn-helix domain-containing protein [bacterium]
MTNNNKNNIQSITGILGELLDSHDMSEQKLAHATDVPLRFISALRHGEFDKLPARPYVHGYIKKIADTFNQDENDLWQSYLASLDTQSQTPHKYDRLPGNRFVNRSFKTKKLISILIFVAVLIFFGIRFNTIVGKPKVTLSLSTETMITNQNVLTITGTVTPGDKLALNTEIIYTNKQGSFEKEIALTPGLNTLEFTVHRFLGRKATITRQVVYEPLTTQ